MRIPFLFLQGVVFALFVLSAHVLAQEADQSEVVQPGKAPTYDSGDGSDRDDGYVGPGGRARPGLLFFNKGVAAFKKKQYAFAIEMYAVSASWAYKPAHYNLAVIYAKGEGVDADLPRAMAWSALAAERGDPYYLQVREAINAELDAEQIARANVILDELKPKYADERALRKAKSRWKDVKLEATGSRLGAVGNIKVGAPGSSLGGSQRSEIGAKESAAVTTNAWEATGGKQVDGSIAYRELRETDNPYDPKHRSVTGTATVGPIGPIGPITEVAVTGGGESSSEGEPGKE